MVRTERFIYLKYTKSIYIYRFNVKFPKIRPDWLVNPDTGRVLELDGYNECLHLAFEYNGPFHYDSMGRDERTMVANRIRDQNKIHLCEQHGVDLIVIPYTEDANIREYILEKLTSIDRIQDTEQYF